MAARPVRAPYQSKGASAMIIHILEFSFRWTFEPVNGY